MKRLVLGGVVVAALLVMACSQGSTGSPANLIGTQDMVLVDELNVGGGVADEPPENMAPTGGLPNRYLFITSPDTNELRVLETYRPPVQGRAFVQAPNPLETLSIPVLDRPSMLTADEGLDLNLRRVTGAYVYAGRTGGTQLSVIDASAVTGFRQVTRSPLPLPGPLTAFAGWMGQDLTMVPAVTHLYFATWNGTTSAVYDYAFPTTRAAADITAAKVTLVADFGGESVIALKVVPGLAGRTLNGQPFCAGSTECLVVATRANQGRLGRTIMLEPKSLRVAPIGFPTAVREVTTVGDGSVLWAILSEEECTATTCGGVIAVETKAAVTPVGFPIAPDFTGQAMAPLTLGAALPRGLTLAKGPRDAGPVQLPGIRITSLHDATDAGSSGVVLDDAGTQWFLSAQQYEQIGFFSNANGEVVPFDATTRMSIDYDGRRPTLIAATLRVPGTTDDGGVGFFYDDGGANFTQFDGGITPVSTTGQRVDILTDPTYSWAITAQSETAAPFSLTVADGYLLTQTFTVANQGVIPGFSQLTTSGQSPVLTFTQGLESRLAAGDRVLFGQPADDGGVSSCGEAQVTSVDAGVLTVSQVPAACTNVSAFTVRATGPEPIIVSGDVEGFIARTHVGATIVYRRRYLVAPIFGTAGDQPPALTMTIGDIDPTPGAYWAFSLVGRVQPMRMSFDPTVTPCTPYVPGKVLAARLPQYSNTTATLFAWDLLTLVPAGNGVIELAFIDTFDNGSANLSRITCYR